MEGRRGDDWGLLGLTVCFLAEVGWRCFGAIGMKNVIYSTIECFAHYSAILEFVSFLPFCH